MSREQSPVAFRIRSYFKFVMGVLVGLILLAYIASFAIYVFGNGVSAVPTSTTMMYLIGTALLTGAVASIIEIMKSKTQTL